MDLIYPELNEIYREQDLLHDDNAARQAAVVVDRMAGYSYNTRINGILTLDEVAEEKDDFLSRIFLHIVDGCDAKDVKEIAFAEYVVRYSREEPLKRLLYLLQLAGALEIQQNGNPHLIADRLIAMSPIMTRQYYDAGEFKSDWRGTKPVREIPREELDAYLKKLCSRNPEYTENEKAQAVTDRALATLSQEGMSRLMYEVDIFDLEMSMKTFSGTVNKKILSAMPKRLAREVVENLYFMKSESVFEPEKYVMSILQTLLKLCDADKIIMEDQKAFSLAMDFFHQTRENKTDWSSK